MIVRRLTPRYAKDMAAIHGLCFEAPWPALDMAVHVERDLCLGVGDPLRSFAILRRSDVDAEILTIATHPDERGQGFAGLVLAHAHRALQKEGLRDVFLEVAEDNDSAMALYRRLGYRPIGRRPAYYRREGGRVAAISYALSLAASGPCG